MSSSLSAEEFRDLYTIYAFDLGAQRVVNNVSEITIDIKRKAIPAADTASANPQSVNIFFIMLCERTIEITSNPKMVKLIE